MGVFSRMATFQNMTKRWIIIHIYRSTVEHDYFLEEITINPEESWKEIATKYCFEDYGHEFHGKLVIYSREENTSTIVAAISTREKNTSAIVVAGHMRTFIHFYIDLDENECVTVTGITGNLTDLNWYRLCSGLKGNYDGRKVELVYRNNNRRQLEPV